MAIVFFIILFDVANCGFISYSGDGTCTTHIIATKQLFSILMCNFLVGHGMRAWVIRVMPT